MAMVAGMLAAAGGRGAEDALALSNCDTGSAALDSGEQQLVSLINEYRAGAGLAPLAVSPNLSRAAAWMAEDLTADGYFDHFDNSRPGGRSPFQRAVDCGYGSSNVGEILAKAVTGGGALTLWKGSPGHNSIILKSNWTVMGIGRAGSTWAVVFGALNDSGGGGNVPTVTRSASPAASPSPTPSPTPAPPVIERRATLQMVSAE